VTDTAPATGLAFKAREIEEIADVYFFRPFGMIFALAARALHLSPTAVTIIGTVIGAIGGALLAWPERAVAGFLLIMLYGVLDSSDGQLARMTGQSTDFGRMLDGAGGYVVHVAAYLAIIVSALARGRGWDIVLLAVASGLANIVHAQLYDYHRTTYVTIAIKGEPTRAMVGRPHTGIVGIYETMQRALSGRHPEVERVVAARHTSNGHVPPADRLGYRACFYWPVRGWNLMGDNTRFYAIGVCAWLGHVEWFLLFELLPMNVALVAMWWWQARADRRFLTTVW
jgi:phosphatidylglycerophosphate synthase